MKTYRPLFVFYFLIFYIFASYFWWAYLLLNKNKLLLQERIFIAQNHVNPNQNLELVSQLNNDYARQRLMIIGEGAVFIILISLGAWQIRRSFLQEIELNKQQRNFLLSITHELKSPLASIQLSLQTITTKKPTEIQAEQLMRNTFNDVDRLKILVEKILIATKIEAHQEQFVQEEVNFSELLIDHINILKSSLGKHCTFITNIKDNVYLNADPTALELICSNIIENAIKYSTSNKTIAIDLTQKNDNTLLCVSDFGIGISIEDKKHIFKKFFRVGSEETRTSKGTGLGLYLVKQLVEMYKGSIQVTDNHPCGTRFLVTFFK